MTDRPTMIVVDDEPLLVDAFEAVLTRHGFDVVGKAGSAADALRLRASHPADVLLLDLQIPGEEGHEYVRNARRTYPEMIVVAVSAPDADDDIEAALRAGADAVVMKSAAPDDVAGAVRAALGGDSTSYSRERTNARATRPA